MNRIRRSIEAYLSSIRKGIMIALISLPASGQLNDCTLLEALQWSPEGDIFDCAMAYFQNNTWYIQYSKIVRIC